MPIVVSGPLATSVFSATGRKQFSPQPAAGTHAETLVEMTETANALLKMIELERSGVCDGAGFWMIRDPVLNTARKLVALAEQRGCDATPGPTG
jgi:hypothetical protein